MQTKTTIINKSPLIIIHRQQIISKDQSRMSTTTTTRVYHNMHGLVVS